MKQRRKRNKRSPKRKRYRWGPSKTRPNMMLLVVHRDKKAHIHCGCGRDHGVLDEHFENIGFSESLPQGVVEIERHDRSGKIVRIAKVACKCGMRSRFAEDFSCDDPRACPACGACIECGLCSCRDENPFGSYR